MNTKLEIERLMKERDTIQKQICALQKRCKHEDATFKHSMLMNNALYKIYKCPTCLLEWEEDELIYE